MGYGQYSYNTFEPRNMAQRGNRDGAFERLPDGTLGKRVKAVMSISQVIHAWASRAQTCGQSGKGNVYFKMDRLFDYGDHFCMGQFVTNDKGQVACFLNSDSYGPTTSGHQNETARAIPPGIPKFVIPGAGYKSYSNNLDHAAIMASYKARATELAGKAKRARDTYRIDWSNAAAAALVTEAKELAVFFGMPVPDFQLDALVAEAKANADRARKAERERQAAARIKSQDDYTAWQNGSASYCPHEWQRDERGGVRMRIKGNLLQTAMGAEVPLAHAIKVFRFVKKCKTEGVAWHRNGTSVRVGLFQVDSVEANGDFKAGCHSFTWEGVEAAAKAAGVFDLAAADARESTAQAA